MVDLTFFSVPSLPLDRGFPQISVLTSSETTTERGVGESGGDLSGTLSRPKDTCDFRTLKS